MTTTESRSQTHLDEDAMLDELRFGLRNYWYPILLSTDLGDDKPVGITRLGEELALWRDGDGTVHTFADRCAHRGVKLSAGDVVGGRLACRYHGLQYDGTGQCRFAPIEGEEDGPQAKRLCVTSYPTEEHAGIIWAYIGDLDVFPAPPFELDAEVADPNFVWIVKETTWEANWLLVHDNTSDPVHLPFLHGNYAARVTDDGIRFDPIGGGEHNPVVTEEVSIDTVRDDLEAIPTENGVLVTRKGADDDHSETFDEVEFSLPCDGRVWVPVPVEGVPPVRSIQYELPVDDASTVVYAYMGVQVPDDQREMAQGVLEEFVWPNFRQVFMEDSWISSLQGDLRQNREGENLLSSDVGPARVRRLIYDAYRRQAAERAAAGNGEVGVDPPSAAG